MKYENIREVAVLRKLGRSFQVALPRRVIKLLGLKINDYLEVSVKGGKIILEPRAIIPKSQAYFFAPEWQEGEQEAEEDIREGRVTKTKDLKGLFKKLDE